MTTAISPTASTHQSLDTSIAAPRRFDHDTKVIAILFAAAVALSMLLSAGVALIYYTASPDQMEQITTMMAGYTPAL